MPGLEDLYREVILDHYRNPRNRGELPSPPATKAEGFNPLCGDQVTLTFTMEGDTLSDVKFAGSGCSISQSSVSMMTAAIKGKTIDQARQLIHDFKVMMSIHEAQLDEAGDVTLEGQPGQKLGDLEALQGVVKFPVRIKCATLSWNTLQQGLDQTGHHGLEQPSS